MRHPRIAIVCVVLDEHEAAARHQQRHETGEDPGLVADEVQRVRHHDAVQWRKRERRREVALRYVTRAERKAPEHRRLLLPQRRRIAIDGPDLSVGPEHVGQRQRERAAARSEVGPAQSGASDPRPDQLDVVAMVHSGVGSGASVRLIGSA